MNKKINLKVIVFGIGLLFLALFAILPNKNVSANGYATEWKMSEGNSFRVISGNLGTNTNGQPYEVSSGQQSSFFVTYSTMPKDLNGPDLIQAGKMAFRIKLPKDFKGELGRVANDNWTLKEGSLNDPSGTPNTDGERYYWMVNTVDTPISSSDTLTFFLKPFINGVTDNKKDFDFSVTLMNLNNNTSVSVEQKSSYTAKVDKFNWNKVSNSTTGQNQVFERNNSEQAIDNPIKDLSFTLSTSPNPNNVDYNTNNTVLGTGFAKAVIFNSTYALPVDDANGDCPLIKLDKSMFYDENDVLIPSENITLVKNDADQVIGFSIKSTQSNPDINNQFKNPTFKFKIKGSTLNSSCPLIKDMPADSSKVFSISETSTSHEVVPSVKLDSSVTLNENGNLNLAQNSLVKLDFTYRVSEKEMPMDSYKEPVKSIKTISGKPVSNTDLAAYPGDTVQFELGAEHIKNKNTNVISMEYKEVEGSDYNASIIKPVQIRMASITGSVTKFKIEVKYKDGEVKNYDRLNNELLVFEDADQIESYTITNDIAIGQTVQVGHLVDYKVIDQKDLSKDGIQVINKVSQKYKNGDTEKANTAQTSFTYHLKPINGAGLSETNKSAANLAGKTPHSTPKAKDVIQFTIYMRDEQGAQLYVDEIIDHFTNGTLTPYNGTTTTVDGSDAIDTRLLNDTNELNLLLWDKNPDDGSSTPIAFPGGKPDIVIDKGIVKIKFKENIIIPANKSYYITYTMSVNSEYNYDKYHTIGNEFNSYRNGFKNGEGIFYWTKMGNGEDKSINKWHKNISVPTSIKYPWSSYPYGGDVGLYMAKIENNTKNVWDGNIEFNDTYTEELKPFKGKTGINMDNIDVDKLNFDNPYNIAALNKGEKITVRGPQGSMELESTATEFDPTKISVVDNYPSERSFKVNLGEGNKIKPGESVYLVYTMQVVENVSPTDDNEHGTKENEIINTCNITYNGLANGQCSDTWQVNPNENINGVIDLTKGVTKITDNHPTSRVEHGDEIDYKVTMSNDHIKANKYVKIETLLDKLPSNLKYVDNTFKIKFFETEYDAKNSSSNPDDNISGPGTRKELPLPSGADDYKLTLVDTDGDGKEDSIKVDWKKPIDLTAGSYTDNTFQKVKTFSYEFEYTLEADTTGIPENNRTLDQKNRVHVFTTNPVDELNRKNGVIVNDTQSNLDGKESTKSYIYQEANIKLINDSFNYGALTKSVTSNNNTFNIESNSEGRSYAINISNTGAKDYTISRFVDILPIYEKYKEGTMKINNASVDEASIKKGIYSNSDDIVKQQRLMHDEDLVVPANSKITITYDTVVDKESINTKMIETQNNEIKNLKNSFAFYMKDNATLLINDGGSKQADDGNKPDENWDDDKETKIRFQGDVGVGYIDNSIVPGIDINPYIVLDSGATQPYIQNVTPVNPGDNLAWRIKVGNASNASSNLIKGSKIVAVLPEGVVFDETNPDNQYVESTAAVTGNVDGTFVANKNKPSWLSDPTIKMSPTKQQIIVWTITDGDYGRSQGAGFTIRTKTQQYKFTSYAPEVYLVPIQESNQDFYENIMNSSGNNLLFNVWPGYQHMFGDLSSLIENGKNVHHVKDSTFVDVYGAYGLSAYKKVSDGKNTVTSRDANRLLKLDSRQDKFKYTLRLEAVKNDTRLSKLVFIDRLPSTGDIGVVTDGKRDSETPIRLDDNGNVKVSHKESATSATKTLDESQYRLEYFFGAANEKFSDNDKNGVVQSGRWYSEAEVVAANKEFSKATAIRVAIVDENIIIGALGEMEITFDAHLGEKVEDYNKSEAIGFNTFGYSLAYGAAMNDLKSEVVSVGVNAEVPDAQATIVKNVDLDGHTSAKSREYFESVDENRNFTFTLKGVDENNIEKDTKEFDINANVQNAKGYTGSVLIENLDPSLTYSISEKNNPNFVMSLESSKKIVGDQLQYTYTFTNKWQPLKIDLNKKWLDAKGNVIPTSNLNTLLKDYVKKDVDVDLYNSANVDVNLNTGETTAKDDSTTDNVDESTLPIESLRLGNAKVSLDTLNGSFGYYNQFDKNGSKLVYSLNERSGSINHSIFNITTSYKQEELIGTYTLNNKILGGDLELVKKDDLGNTLSGVEFELEDMLNQKTTHYTDESGKINLSTLNPGNYKFSEVEAPVGYEKLTSPIEFTIQPNAPTTLALEAINTIIRGDVELTKKDDLSNLLPGAQFELYTSDNQKIGETYTTNENGLIAVDNLLPNDYYFIEIKAPVGYDKAEGKISFTIPKNPSETIKVSAENKIIRGDVLLTKKDENDKVLKNAEFILVNENDQQIGSTYTTDVSGTIAVDKLLPGDYKFKETKAPDGYLMMPDVNDREYQFTIAHNPQNTVNVVAYNHQPLEFDLKAKKKVVGKKAPDSKFKFTLKGQNNAPMPQGSKGDSKEVNAGVGEIDFGKIKYTKVGEYKYTLVENKGNVKGFEYDKNKYTLNVNVGFNGRRMIYKVNYQQNGKDIQTKMVTFVNRYKGDISTTGTNEMFIAGISALLGITLYGTKLYYRKRNI